MGGSPDSRDDENGNRIRCGHPFSPHIITPNDATDLSRGGEMRYPVEECLCFSTISFDMKKTELERDVANTG
jgi:hypothetical protein